jgi:hypothetical protein
LFSCSEQAGKANNNMSILYKDMIPFEREKVNVQKEP